jgi:hypothetical protein
LIRNYDEFIEALLKAGFSGAIGGKDEGVFGLFRYGWGAVVRSTGFHPRYSARRNSSGARKYSKKDLTMFIFAL